MARLAAWRISRALCDVCEPGDNGRSLSLQSLVAATSSLAVLRVGDFGVRTEASLRVAAPVDAAAGVGDIELPPRVDEHLLTPEQTAVFLGNSDATGIVGHKQPSCDRAVAHIMPGGAYMPLFGMYATPWSLTPGSRGGQNSAFHSDARELDLVRILAEWGRFADGGFSRFVSHVFTDRLSSQRFLSFRRRPRNGRHVTEDNPRALHGLSVHVQHHCRRSQGPIERLLLPDFVNRALGRAVV